MVSSLAILAALAAPAAHAQTTAISNIVAPLASNSGAFSLGFQFTATAPLTVSQLGAFDEGGDGLTQAHEVGLYRVSDQALLASTTITNASDLDNLFRYNAITPVALTSGQDYIVTAVFFGAGDAYQYNSTSFTAANGIAFVGSRYQSGSTLAYASTNGNGEKGYFSANFKIGAGAAAPEPGSLSLLGMGLVTGAGMVGTVRRRKQAA